ncbi:MULTISPECIES: hypothetical protein [Bacillus]|uniref:hypothetical protein n=1 Tax=Bacillus TaxID=1386 RepID=UPI00065BCD83|nr:hypothetical protein [Bacillus wiedmannii]KMP92431.1 hypothetical protein TU65_22810 [Bacillus wiedmannii]MCU5703469.1 hypothetical protein [Bacillus wiedmannii]PTC12724.1 hypothetical protein C6557_15220 [Bacillus wiedmannii]HDX9649756.1 hypothetical protein [Bacillus wiedmannii]
MEFIIGKILLLFVLSLFSFFSFKALKGMKAMGVSLVYPTVTGSKTPTSKFGWGKEVRWESGCP